MIINSLENTVSNNKRMSYIDIMKGIGIFLVIWAHLSRDLMVTSFIYGFHMPLFFYFWIFV